jgi:hypothetical protein
VITHENSTTMSLYGYGLAQYVVEFSLGIPTSCDGRTAGMFGEAVMAEPMGCSVKLRWLNRVMV